MSQQNAGTSTDNTSKGQWTDNERITAGQMAAQAMNNPIIQVVFDLLSQKYYRDWLLSEDKEFKTRESCWYKRIALTELMTDMRDMVSEAQEVVARQQEKSDPEAIKKAHMDEQGFGLNFSQER